MFFESKANAKKIIMANLGQLNDEEGVYPRYVDPPNKEIGSWLGSKTVEP
jgi:hypothetical protein